MIREVSVRDRFRIGERHPPVFILGPCVLESEELAFTVAEFVAERMLPVVGVLRESLLAAGGDARALLAAFVTGIHEAVARYPWWPQLWVREVLSDSGALRETLHTQIAPQVTHVLARTLAGARERGEVSKDLDPRLLVVSLMGLTMFPLAAEPIWRRLFPADDIDRAALRRHTLALLDHGLGAPHAR